jgi:BON domain
VTPLGEVQRVLETSRGPRLLVARAFAPGSYAVIAGEEVAGVEVEVEEEGAAEAPLRWATVRTPPATIFARGTFRREMGRLRPDPLAPGWPPVPDDAQSQARLAAALRADPLVSLGGADVALRVRHGVAILRGWVRTVAGKVQAIALARGTAGIWATRGALHSDEEIGAGVRAALRARPEVAAVVSGYRIDLGTVVLSLHPAAGPEVAGGALQAVQGAPGVRSAVAGAASE